MLPTCSLTDLAGPLSWAVEELLLSCTKPVRRFMVAETAKAASLSRFDCGKMQVRAACTSVIIWDLMADAAAHSDNCSRVPHALAVHHHAAKCQLSMQHRRWVKIHRSRHILEVGHDALDGWLKLQPSSSQKRRGWCPSACLIAIRPGSIVSCSSTAALACHDFAIVACSRSGVYTTTAGRAQQERSPCLQRFQQVSLHLCASV